MLKMRIQILKNGGVIGEDVAEFMNKWRNFSGKS